MSDSEFQHLMDVAGQRKLTAAEEARLRAQLETDPSARRVWEEEASLNRLLQQLPDTPLASNFTAQVLQKLDREGRAKQRAFRGFERFAGIKLVYRFAWACSLLALAFLGHHQYHSFARARMAASLASIAGGVESAASVAQLPSVEFWQDFEPISRLPISPGRTGTGADEELLAALR